jgi:hypothetical protein
MPGTANNLAVEARQLSRPAIGVSQVCSISAGFGEGSYSRNDAPVKGQIARELEHHARHIQKIIVKPYAGKPHVRFERGFMETGQR